MCSNIFLQVWFQNRRAKFRKTESLNQQKVSTDGNTRGGSPAPAPGIKSEMGAGGKASPGAGAELGAGLAADDPGWDHMSSALWGIVLGTISFLTIVGNIMVSSDNSVCRNIYKIFLLNFRKTRILRRFM